jgi:hypothetical protein
VRLVSVKVSISIGSRVAGDDSRRPEAAGYRARPDLAGPCCLNEVGGHLLCAARRRRPGCLNEVGGKGWGGAFGSAIVRRAPGPGGPPPAAGPGGGPRVRVGYRARHDVAGPGCVNPTECRTTREACESASQPTAISSPPDQFEQRLNLNYLR